MKGRRVELPLDPIGFSSLSRRPLSHPLSIHNSSFIIPQSLPGQQPSCSTKALLKALRLE